MKANQRLFVLIATAATTLCGCSPEPQAARYTVDEYLSNPDAMDAKLKECANNPGDSANDPDCVNVRAAAERKGIGSLRDLPPLGLNPPPTDEQPKPPAPAKD
jgi:hypothetical protein